MRGGCSRGSTPNSRSADYEHRNRSRGNRVQLRAEAEALVATLTTGPEGDPVRLRQVLEEHINRFAFREAPLPFEWGEAAA